MISHVLDTDMLTLFQEGHPVVCRRMLERPAEAIAVTVLTVEEQLSGWYTQVRQAKSPARLAWAYGRLAANVRLLSRLQILPHDEPAIARFEQLRKLKLTIGKLDLRIAATVMERGATLVTRNKRDFQQIPGLRLEDWSQ